MSKSSPLVVVCGAGGFIGGHLTKQLQHDGYQVRAIDIKPSINWEQHTQGVEELQLDLRVPHNCEIACKGATTLYNLAADMGGMGYIETHKAECMLNVLINTHLMDACRKQGVGRFFFASSACVYAAGNQTKPDVVALSERDAYPADPEDGYGWEKLFSERMCRHMREDYRIETRIGRYHNVYGPFGTFRGGREKAPAAICRKVIEAQLSGKLEIEIWGDGHQTRSFTYINDCLTGTRRLTDSDFRDPLNIGSSELVSINTLVDIVEEIAGVRLQRHYRLNAPKGVRGRNSDNTLIRSVLGWEPSTPLRTGLERTYHWIRERMTKET